MIIIIEVRLFKINVAETLQKVCIWFLTPPPAPPWHYFPFSSHVELYLRPLSIEHVEAQCVTTLLPMGDCHSTHSYIKAAPGCQKSSPCCKG